jgi:hypothetical protein
MPAIGPLPGMFEFLSLLSLQFDCVHVVKLGAGIASLWFDCVYVVKLGPGDCLAPV